MNSVRMYSFSAAHSVRNSSGDRSYAKNVRTQMMSDVTNNNMLSFLVNCFERSNPKKNGNSVRYMLSCAKAVPGSLLTEK